MPIFSNVQVRRALAYIFSLELACAGDSSGFRVFVLARITSGSLDSLDDFHGILIRDLSKDNMLAIKPRCDHSGNKELPSRISKQVMMVRYR